MGGVGWARTDAGRLAAHLGDLPLAVAQAAGFMADTGTPATRYIDLLQAHAGRLLDQAVPGTYPRSLATATGLTAEQLISQDLAAAQLADLCAFLAPEPIPEDLFAHAPGRLPADLAARAADPIAWRQTLALLARQSLIRLEQRGLVMHRLTQAILRDRLTADKAAAARTCSEAVLTASNPRDQHDPVTWPRWAQLMPHLLAADLAVTDNQDLRWMALNACGYLLRRGDNPAGFDLASRLHENWRQSLGPDHEHTLRAAMDLAWALRNTGRYALALALDRDTVDRKRRLVGQDHPDALVAATYLAADLRLLGETQAAADMDRDIWNLRRRILGEDHRYTLISATYLATDLYSLGDVQAARDLDQDTLARRCRVLGPDHPETLLSASNLAADLRALGDAGTARDMDYQTRDRRRKILGQDHPDTLTSASNLAGDLRTLGDVHAALALDQDTLERRRRVLGDDHPDTMLSASNLAADLSAPGTTTADSRGHNTATPSAESARSRYSPGS